MIGSANEADESERRLVDQGKARFHSDFRPFWGLVVFAIVAAACSSGDDPSANTPPLVKAATTTSRAEPATTSTTGPTTIEPRARSEADPEAPNIIVFMTDDMAVNHLPALPRMQELIGDVGLTFDKSYVNYPTCCPSRATFLTGQHALNHRVLWNVGPNGGFANFENQHTALPPALHASGYETYFVGKYLNGFGYDDETQYTPPGWSSFHGLVEPSAVLYDKFSIFHEAEIVHYGETGDDYVTDVMTELALDDLAAHEAGDGPFMMWMSYPAPHPASGISRPAFEQGGPAVLADAIREGEKPPVPAPRHLGLAADIDLPKSESYNEEDIKDKIPPLRRKPLKDEPGIESRYRAEYESLISVDESIESIISSLDDLGELENTYFLFTSDNGQFHGQHRFSFGKYFPYEPSSRVPLLISGPDVRVGRSDLLVSNVDLAPTIADLADVELLRPPDGKSLVPVLTDPDLSWERALFIEGYGPIRELRPQFNVVRSDRWFYAEWSSGHRELYDMIDDPEQLENVVSDPVHDEVIQQHQRWLTELRECGGPECAEVGNIPDT